MKKKRLVIGLVTAIWLAWLGLNAPAAEDIRKVPVHFRKGASRATIQGRIKGRQTTDYVLNARAGQTMTVNLQANNSSAYCNVLPPGSDEAIFIGSVAGPHFEGPLPKDGDYRVRVYLVRAAARRQESATYTLTVKVTGGPEEHAKAQNPAGSSPAQDLKDFGVSDVEVRSVKSFDTTAINAEVGQAAGQGENWPHEAVLVGLKLVGEGLKGSTKIIEVRTPPESQETATITVTESGYLDDAIGGERWRLWLKKGPDGTWVIQRALWAQLCNRPGSKFYSAGKCP